ncbi:hypothetical protein BDZ89DRAFT_1149855 [Hymenopellis radicata]|nr:hypothetical protein BDZ89DRAFT_1149855 [Hymenopellis radicata]
MMQIRWDWKYPRDRGCPSHDRVCHRVMSSCFFHTNGALLLSGLGTGFTLMVSFACFGEQSTFSFIAPATIPDHPLSSAKSNARDPHTLTFVTLGVRYLALTLQRPLKRLCPRYVHLSHPKLACVMLDVRDGSAQKLHSIPKLAGVMLGGDGTCMYFVASELAGVTLDVEDGSAQKLHSIPKLAGVMLGGERMAEFGRVTDWNRARQQLRRTRQIRDRCTCFFHPTTIPCHLRPHSSYTLESRSPCLPTAQR